MTESETPVAKQTTFAILAEVAEAALAEEEATIPPKRQCMETDQSEFIKVSLLFQLNTSFDSHDLS